MTKLNHLYYDTVNERVCISIPYSPPSRRWLVISVTDNGYIETDILDYEQQDLVTLPVVMSVH